MISAMRWGEIYLNEGVFPHVPDLLTIRRDSMRLQNGLHRWCATTNILVSENQVGGFSRSCEGMFASTEYCILRVGDDILEFRGQRRCGYWRKRDGSCVASSRLSLMRKFFFWGRVEIDIYDFNIQLRMPLVGPSFHQVRPCFMSVNLLTGKAKICLEQPTGSPQMLFFNEYKDAFASLPREAVLVLIGEALRARSLYPVP